MKERETTRQARGFKMDKIKQRITKLLEEFAEDIEEGVLETWIDNYTEDITKALKQECQKYIDAEGTIAFQLHKRKMKEYKERFKKMIEEEKEDYDSRIYYRNQPSEVLNKLLKKLEEL